MASRASRSCALRNDLVIEAVDVILVSEAIGCEAVEGVLPFYVRDHLLDLVRVKAPRRPTDPDVHRLGWVLREAFDRCIARDGCTDATERTRDRLRALTVREASHDEGHPSRFELTGPLGWVVVVDS